MTNEVGYRIVAESVFMREGIRDKLVSAGKAVAGAARTAASKTKDAATAVGGKVRDAVKKIPAPENIPGKTGDAVRATIRAGKKVGDTAKSLSGYNDFRNGKKLSGAGKAALGITSLAALGYGVHKLRQRSKAKKAAKEKEGKK